MNNPILARRLVTLALASLFLVAGSGFAKGPPDDDGPGKGNKGGQKQEQKAQKQQDKAEKRADKQHDKAEKRADKRQREDVKVGAHFSEQHRTQAREYYTQHYGGGKSCPPGLAKKNNGCMPPGQAKKWNVGQPLPAGVTYYAVPHAVVVTLPPVPVGYKYVRVASDILLIAVGSQMVVDGIAGLMR
jgi:Ni/Co efflux regulator RcnB